MSRKYIFHDWQWLYFYLLATANWIDVFAIKHIVDYLVLCATKDCCGFMEGLLKEMPTTKLTNSGNRITAP